jgi:PAS domain S-box-containing protein
MKDKKINTAVEHSCEPEDVRRRLAELENLIGNADVGVYESLPEGRYRYVNQKMADIFGFEDPEEMTASVTDIANQLYASPEERRILIDKILAGGIVDSEFMAKRKDGSIFWSQIHAWALRDKDGNFERLQGFFLDISKRKAQERALIESERKYRDLYEHSTDGIIIADAESRILDANPTALEILGYDLDEICHMDGVVLNHPDDRMAITSINKNLPFGETFRFKRRFRKKDGDYVPVEVHIRRLDRERHQVLFSDITERTRMEQALKSSHDELERRVEERTRELALANMRLKSEIEERRTYERNLKQSENELMALLNAATQPIALIDADGRVFKANRAMQKTLLDADSGDFPGGVEGLMAPDALPDRRRLLDTVRRTRQPVRFCTTRSDRLMEFSIFPVRSEGGDVDRMALYAHDLTEEKQMMDRLAESREQYKFVTDNQMDVIWILDRNLDATYVSPSIQRLTGFTVEEFMRMPWAERFTDEGLSMIYRSIGPEINAETVAAFFEANSPHEVQAKHKHGSGVWTETTCGVLRDRSGAVTGFFGATRDISARKKAEEKLKILAAKVIEAQENERKRIGRELHDSTAQTLSAFKALLEGEIKRLGKKLPDEDLNKLRRIVPALQDTIIDLRRIITNLRPTMLDDMGLAAAVGWLCKEQEIYSRNVGVPFDIRLHDYEGDPEVDTAVFRVVQEVLANALKHSGADLIRVKLEHIGEKLVLTVNDNGCGISPDRLDESEGIGLQSIRERIEPLNGKLSISTRPDRGTRVTATFPVPPPPLDRP